MESAQPILFRIGDVCVDRTTFQFEKALQMQKVQIRRFSSDGAKAIVHYTHCPMGMVFAVDVRLLIAVPTGSVIFNIGDVCVDRTKFHAGKELQKKTVQIRKFICDGVKAIVHYTHCPMEEEMVFAVDVRLLNAVDADGFLRPSPYTWLFKRPAGDTLCSAAAKRARKE